MAMIPFTTISAADANDDDPATVDDCVDKRLRFVVLSERGVIGESISSLNSLLTLSPTTYTVKKREKHPKTI